MGFPNREAYIVGKRVLKYKDIGQIRVLFKRLSWNPAVRRRFPWLPNSILKINRLLNSIGFKLSIQFKYRKNIKGIKIRTVDSSDERFNSFWDTVKKQHNIIGVRDQRYLNWRYKKPGSKYQILIAERGNELVGYIVTSVKTEAGANVGYIVDLLANNTYRAEYNLIKRALLWLISRKVDYALCWMLPDKEAFEVLRCFGFIEKDAFPAVNVVHLIFNFEKVDEMFIKDIKNWYFTMADSDAF